MSQQANLKAIAALVAALREAMEVVMNGSTPDHAKWIGVNNFARTYNDLASQYGALTNDRTVRIYDTSKLQNPFDTVWPSQKALFDAIYTDVLMLFNLVAQTEARLTGTLDISEHVFDVALSFPGEVRPLVEEIVQELERRLGPNTYFYDKNYVSQLARPSLDTLLQGIYSRAKLDVVFLSTDYQKKDWCGVEFRAVREIIAARENDRVMFVRTDDGEVEGVFKTDGYVDARRYDSASIAKFVCQRLDVLLRSPTPILAETEIAPVVEHPVQLTLTYVDKQIRSQRHDYQLRVNLTNNGTKSITQWHVDVVIPTVLLEPGVTHAIRVPERSNQNLTLMRATQDTHGGDIYPNDSKLVMTIDYRVDNTIFSEQKELFEQNVSATAYVHGELAAMTERSVADLNEF